jgi:hypothetical protein
VKWPTRAALPNKALQQTADLRCSAHTREAPRGPTRPITGDKIIVTGGPVASAKQTVRDVLKKLPDDCSLEDVQYQLYLRQELEKSLAAAAEGRVVPHEEVKKRLAKWLAR